MQTPEAVPADRFADLPVTWFKRRRRGKLRRALAALAGSTLIYGLTAVLVAPPVIFLGAGLWSVVSYTRSILTLWDEFKSGQIQAFLHGLGDVNLAVSLALASGAFFALLLALIVLFSALLGRGVRLVLLVPGLLLGVPAGLVFVIAIQTAMDPLAATFGLSAAAVIAVTSYAALDLVVLAAVLTDLRPRSMRRRRLKRAALAEFAPLPLVRFGPARSFVVAATPHEDSGVIETVEGPLTDPTMTATVARALNDSLPVTILPVAPVAPAQRDDALTRDAAEIGE